MYISMDLYGSIYGSIDVYMDLYSTQIEECLRQNDAMDADSSFKKSRKVNE